MKSYTDFESGKLEEKCSYEVYADRQRWTEEARQKELN